MADRIDSRPRKRKVHTKSRRGCANCKIRRVKCDERQPRCQKCAAYGLQCSYGSDATEMEMVMQQRSGQWAVHEHVEALPRMLALTAVSADANSRFELDRKCLDQLHRFERHTVYTLAGTSFVDNHRSNLMSMSYQNPYLMHAILTLVATHERFMNPSDNRPRALFKAYHWSECAALFKRALEGPIQPRDWDPLYATSMILSIVGFSSIEVTDPEDSWPLVDSATNLQWLGMNAGKEAVWRVTNPFRDGGMFRFMLEQYGRALLPLPRKGCRGIDPGLARLCNLDASSTIKTNPYYAMAHLVTQLRDLPGSQIHACQYLSVVIYMQQYYQELLYQKDPVALLLLAHWFAMARRAVWWIKARPQVESSSICLYLQRYHGDNQAIQELLPRLDDEAAPVLFEII